VSRPQSAAAKNIDIADILGSEISVNMDIGKYDIDPAPGAYAEVGFGGFKPPPHWTSPKIVAQ